MRRAVSPSRRNVGTPYTFPAPTRGWITNESLANAAPNGAKVLDNFVAQQFSIRPRGGNLRFATVHASSACEELLGYRSGTTSKLFAATSTSIFDVSSPASATVIPAASVTGQTSGDYSHINVSTAGGEFLLAVNGADRMLMFDGSTWRRIDDATYEIAYDTQTANFSVGHTITGGTSGATAVIVEDTDAGTTGTLRVKSVTGTFVDNEIIATGGGGSATSNIPSGAVAVPAVTGADTDDFSHIWLFKSRVFVVKKNSLIAYALPVDSIGGAVTTISLQGVFKLGGKLLFGATWSQDAGDGMDDFCVFVSDQGEIAVYQGTDPSSASAWYLSGVYAMARPIHKNAHMKAGGNLLIATRDGFVPISSAVQKDRAAMVLDAVSRPIQPTWQNYVTTRDGKWVVCKWTAKNYAIIGFPADSEGSHANFVVNLQTGAWSRFTGWNIRCAIEFGDELYLGTSDGKVTKAEGIGNDMDSPYYCTYVGLYERLGSVAQEKVAHMARATWIATTTFTFKLGFAFNYTASLDAYPNSPAESITDLWDVGEWDVAVWDGTGVESVTVDWQSVAGRGFVVAPVMQMTFGGDTVPDVQLVSTDLLYETGGIVT